MDDALGRTNTLTVLSFKARHKTSQVHGFHAPLRGVAGVLDPAGGRGSSDNFEQGYYQTSAFLAPLGRNLVRSPGTPLGGETRRLAFHLALLRSVASSCHLAQFELVPVAEDQLLLMPIRGDQVTGMRTYGLCQNGGVCDAMRCRRRWCAS